MVGKCGLYFTSMFHIYIFIICRRTSANVNLDRHSLVELNDYFANLCQDTTYVEPTAVVTCENVNVPEISEIQMWNNLRHLKKTATGLACIAGGPYWAQW